MPTTSQLIRIPGKGFQPFDPDDWKRVKVGEVVEVTWSKSRNPRFHRKMFALFKFVYESLPDTCKPVEYAGMSILPQRTFDQCRKWMTIEAGFYDVKWNPDGTFAVEAKSLAFGSMDDEEFEKVYNAVIDVALRLLPNIKDGAELDSAVETVLRFDSGG